jgi:hypothetical protein
MSSFGSSKSFGSSLSSGASSGSSSGSSSSEVGTCEIEWDTSIFDGTLGGNPWVVSLGGSRIRFNIEDSENCGGANPNTQSGTATATITVGASPGLLGFSFSGYAEEEATGFEVIEFYLNGVLVASATSPGTIGGDTCLMGAAIVTYHVAPPYALDADSVNTLEINFTTNDPLYHVGAYYEADFNCESL